MSILLAPFKWLKDGWAFADAHAGGQPLRGDQVCSEEERRAAREVALEQLALAQRAGFTHL